MDPLLLTIGMRAIERLVIVLAGAGAIYLGYRLFLAMPNRDRSSGKLELPGGVSIFLSRVGPGVFFSLFGATVIAGVSNFLVWYSSTRYKDLRDCITQSLEPEWKKKEFTPRKFRASPRGIYYGTPWVEVGLILIVAVVGSSPTQ